MASIGAIDLGEVQSERQNKNSQLFQMPVPTQDSDEAVLFDLFGMLKTITISGIITGTDATHVSFIENIEGIMNGSQTGSAFESSKTGLSSITVYIDNFEWSVNKADVSKIDYTLTLIQGAS